ncbi:MAG: LemA family protein, partial [Chitinophagales bacterium]
MKTLKLMLIAISAMFLLPSCSYNNIISQDETVTEAWANVEAAYQRRADLIKNLVNSVKGAKDFEQQTLVDVINARAKATSIQLTADD